MFRYVVDAKSNTDEVLSCPWWLLIYNFDQGYVNGKGYKVVGQKSRRVDRRKLQIHAAIQDTYREALCVRLTSDMVSNKYSAGPTALTCQDPWAFWCHHNLVNPFKAAPPVVGTNYREIVHISGRS